MDTPKTETNGATAGRSSPPACSKLSYRMHIHTNRGGVWEDGETMETEGKSLVDAYTVGIARCQGITKRSGYETRLITVISP